MTSKTKKLLLCLGFISLTSLMFATTDALKNKNAIGVYIIGAELPTGGIQYERKFTDLISEKFGVYAYYSPDEWSNNNFDCSFTAETDFNLYETTWNNLVASRLFAFGLVGYHGWTDSAIIYDSITDTSTKTAPKYYQDAILAAGFGFDFFFFGHLSLPIQFGFMGTFPNKNNIGFCGGTALRYSW